VDASAVPLSVASVEVSPAESFAASVALSAPPSSREASLAASVPGNTVESSDDVPLSSDESSPLVASVPLESSSSETESAPEHDQSTHEAPKKAASAALRMAHLHRIFTRQPTVRKQHV
jgi:hypothetical protein